MVVAYKYQGNMVFCDCESVSFVDKGMMKGVDIVLGFHSGQELNVCNVNGMAAKKLQNSLMGGATTLKVFEHQ